MAHGSAPVPPDPASRSPSASQNLLPTSPSLPHTFVFFQLGSGSSRMGTRHSQLALQGQMFAKQAGLVEAHCLLMVTNG